VVTFVPTSYIDNELEHMLVLSYPGMPMSWRRDSMILHGFYKRPTPRLLGSNPEPWTKALRLNQPTRGDNLAKWRASSQIGGRPGQTLIQIRTKKGVLAETLMPAVGATPP